MKKQNMNKHYQKQSIKKEYSAARNAGSQTAGTATKSTGKKFGENMYLALGIAAVLLFFWFVYTGKLTPLEFIWAPCVYLYMHALTWRKMIQIGSGKKLNSILGETSRNMLFLGLLLAVALN